MQTSRSRTQCSETYYAVLHSARWRSIRAIAVKRANYRCENCRHKTRLDGHHYRGYAMLGQETPEDIQMLCRACHRHAHGRQSTIDVGFYRWVFIGLGVLMVMWWISSQ